MTCIEWSCKLWWIHGKSMARWSTCVSMQDLWEDATTAATEECFDTWGRDESTRSLLTDLSWRCFLNCNVINLLRTGREFSRSWQSIWKAAPLFEVNRSRRERWAGGECWTRSSAMVLSFAPHRWTITDANVCMRGLFCQQRGYILDFVISPDNCLVNVCFHRPCV